jgi:AcrR family transcriptional regulator
LEVFHELSDEKRLRIINAGYKIFGANSYAKASVSDIAKEAGIAKSMVFHYFRTKKEFYFFLMDHCFVLFIETFSNLKVMEITDFFERIETYSRAEMSILRKYPNLFKFIMRFYYERDPEVLEGVMEVITKSLSLGMTMTLDGVDTTKFKSDVDLEQLAKMIRWMGEGLSNQFTVFDESALDVIEREMTSAMKVLKTSLYKEEFI